MAQPVEKTAETFLCDGCGSQLSFDPDSRGLKCFHCGAVQPIESQTVVAEEHFFNPADESFDAPAWTLSEKVQIKCSGCGAATVADRAAMTARCAFCGSNQLISSDESDAGILPETMIPFRVSRSKAVTQFEAWVKKRWFAPFDFKKTVKSGKLTGIYVPYWTFDTDVHTAFSGQGGRYYYVTKTRTNSKGETVTYQERHTHWTPISGEQDHSYDDLTHPGTTKLESGLLAKLGGFSTKVLHVFDSRFLAGFSAQRYDVGPADAWQALQPGVKQKTEKAITGSLGYDTYSGMNYLHTFFNMRFKHILLPVWLSTYRYKDKNFTYMINGESGKAAGKAPVSAVKILLLVGAILAVGAVVFLLTNGQNMNV